MRGNADTPAGVLRLGEPGGSLVNTRALTATEQLVIDVDLRFSAARQGGPEAIVFFSQTNNNEPLQGSNDAWFVRINQEWGAWSMQVARRNAWQTTVLATVAIPQGLTVGS